MNDVYNKVDNTELINILPQYYVTSWKKYKSTERQKIPFTILIQSTAKKALRDLDDDTKDTKDTKDTRNNQVYFSALFDNNTDIIDIVKKRCGVGIESYRNVLKFLLLYNIKRIYKIRNTNNTNRSEVPSYDSMSKKLFRKVRIQNILEGKHLNSHEKKLVNIMNDEAYALCSRLKVSLVPLVPVKRARYSPFINNKCNKNTNKEFFKLVNTHFRIFLNRVIIRFWKSLKINRQFGGNKATNIAKATNVANVVKMANSSKVVKNKYEYDAFISHAWAKDSMGRDNHKRVIAIADGLHKRGIKCWLDKNQMILMEDIVSQMTKGIDNSSVVIACITREYIKKVSGQGFNGPNDNCKIEFDYAVSRKTSRFIIPVIMEPECLNTKEWIGAVGAYLGGLMYINLSMSEKSKGFEKGLDLLAAKIIIAQMQYSDK